MKTWSFRIGITVVATFFLFFAAGGTALGWHRHAYRGHHGHASYGYNGYHHHGYYRGHHHYDDYWGGLALGFGIGVIIPYLFSTPPACNPPVAYAPAPYAVDAPVIYAPAPHPRYRILACEPKHYVEETRWDGRQQRYVVTREYFPEYCWYEYR